MNTLVVDIGGTNVKVWKSGESDKAKFPSGKELTPKSLVDQVKQVAADWSFDRVSIGYPGEVATRSPTPTTWGRAGPISIFTAPSASRSAS